MLAPQDMPPPRHRAPLVTDLWPRVTHRAREQRSDYDDYTWPDDQPRWPRRKRLTTILAVAAIAWAILIFGGQYVRTAIASAPAPASRAPEAVNLRGPVGAGAAPTATGH